MKGFSPVDGQILTWFQKKGQLVIEGNKEYYVILEFSKGKYLYRFGDTDTNSDTETREMYEVEIIEYLKSHYIRKAKYFDKVDIKREEEIWKYIQENPNI